MKPWEQLPEETGTAYEAFLAFRALGWRRSLRRAHKAFAAQNTVVSDVTMFFRWSKKFGWIARARAWDAYQLRKSDARLSQELQAQRVKAERDRLKGRNLATAHALKILEHLAGSSIAGLDERQLLASLQAARAAYEIVGLAAIDHGDQLRSVAPQTSGISREIGSEPTPEELLEVQAKPSQFQLDGPQAEIVLDTPD